MLRNVTVFLHMASVTRQCYSNKNGELNFKVSNFKSTFPTFCHFSLFWFWAQYRFAILATSKFCPFFKTIEKWQSGSFCYFDISGITGDRQLFCGDAMKGQPLNKNAPFNESGYVKAYLASAQQLVLPEWEW